MVNLPKLGAKMRKNLILLIFAFLFISCASTRISSFANPDIDVLKYKKMFVVIDSSDIDFIQRLEKTLVKVFAKNNLEAIPSTQLIPPLKKFSNEEIDNIIEKSGVDSVLSIAIVSADHGSTYIPLQTHTRYDSTFINGRYVFVPYTTTSGGYSKPYSRARFEITLKDIKTDEIVFVSTAYSEGESIGAISKDLSRHIVKQYRKIGEKK